MNFFLPLPFKKVDTPSLGEAKNINIFAKMKHRQEGEPSKKVGSPEDKITVVCEDSLHLPEENGLMFSLNDFNEFLLNNSPINLSPYNSDEEEDPEENINFTFSENQPKNKISFGSVDVSSSEESVPFDTEDTANADLPSPMLRTIHLPSHTLENFSTFASGDASGKNGKPLKKRRFTKLTYENVESTVSKYYLQNKTSNQFDVLITYLQSKKNIYIQSHNLLQIYLTIINCLTLVLTASVAIFAPFMHNYNWSGYFISAINSMIAILIKLKDSLRYESNIENYNKLANQFNHLETSMQLTSNKLQFIKDENIKTKIIIEKIEYLDERLTDINNNFKMTFPEIIKKIFPIITHINIFTFIKRIETYKHFVIIDLQNVKNEIMFLTHKWNMNENVMAQMNLPSQATEKLFNFTEQSVENLDSSVKWFSTEDSLRFPEPSPSFDIRSNLSSQATTNSFSSPLCSDEKFSLAREGKLLFIKDKIRLQNLIKLKENIKIKLFHYKKIYEYIDDIFNEEIKNAESSSYWLYMLFFYKKSKKNKKDFDNPIVKELIRFAL